MDRSLARTRRLEVLPLDSDAAEEAARLGGECGRRGEAVGNLDQITQQNAALVEEAAAAAQSLKDQASGLARMVMSFRLAPGAA